ncbi:DUF2304 domain-containing protein [Cellulomonas septica]|uniref:DUF2304 domain-containing protein n=1 Tax=Cellulomonas septica TaxID=285080 RepID=A0ABX1K137_9CELL|nr:DUF2304 domain-containing protein [Cellulomonas septica]NKY39275.1 DUF2304 domain-containing protein [Cellulomonas septica]
MSGYLFALVASIVTLVFILVLLRRRQLREKYAGIWLVVSFAIIVLAAFPRLAIQIADLVGVETPSNLLFAVSLVVLLLVSIQLSTEISTLEEETRTIAERVAILGERLTRLEGAATDTTAPQEPHARDDEQH